MLSTLVRSQLIKLATTSSSNSLILRAYSSHAESVEEFDSKWESYFKKLVPVNNITKIRNIPVKKGFKIYFSKNNA